MTIVLRPSIAAQDSTAKRWQPAISHLCLPSQSSISLPTSTNSLSFFRSQLPPAAVAALFVVVFQESPKFAGKRSKKQSCPSSSTKFSRPTEKSSFRTMRDKPISPSSSPSMLSSRSPLLVLCGMASSGEVAGELEEGGSRGGLKAAKGSLEAADGSTEVVGFWRVEPARELRWVGAGWLCSAV